MFTALQFGRYTHKARMRAFAQGVHALGGDVIDITDSNPEKVLRLCRERTIAFGFSCGMHPRDAGARGVLNALGIPKLILDLGYIRRSNGPRDEDGYNQLGLGGIGWYPRDDNLPGDRLAALRIKIATPIDPDERPNAVLVLGQKPGDSQHGLAADFLLGWLTERAAAHLATGAELIWRAHPGAGNEKLPIRCNDMPPHFHALEQSLAIVRRVVCFNSTAGLEALLAGVPVECHPSAHYARCVTWEQGAGSRGQGTEIDPERLRAHLRALSYAQWTIPELASGEALRFMNRSAGLGLALNPELAAVHA